MPRTAVKGQVLADLVVEFAEPSSEGGGGSLNSNEKLIGTVSQQEPTCWKAYIDGAANQRGSGVRLVLISPEGITIEKSLRLGFSVTNNEAEYEALLEGMSVIQKLGGKSINMFSDSRLVVGQVNGELEARDEKMQEYLVQVKRLQAHFNYLSIMHLSRSGNTHADSLATLATSSVQPLPRVILVEDLYRPSMVRTELVHVHNVKAGPSWMDPLVLFLKNDILPKDKNEANAAEVILEELHEGICGSHMGGPFPKAVGNKRFLLVGTDYFTKWVKTEPLANIRDVDAKKFIWKNIVTRFGVPHTLISDNDLQFDSKTFRRYFSELGIANRYSTPAYPQGNGQAEAVNKVIVNGLKKRLDDTKGRWVEELPNVLWTYRTTPRRSTGETPFSMTYGAKAVIPLETNFPTLKTSTFCPNANNRLLEKNLDLIEERRERAMIQLAYYQHKLKQGYDAKVKLKPLAPGDLGLQLQGGHLLL
ncbi:uncharacterized protein LOC126701978 [Quercus robur]|uniref:uncharacterized protein LOC126701978 n=1 Tax=Quercus robur TaxID=38942 RepID=UPI0021633649|nr:uncharacterized protein LOC126701978 [Quercus robur]